MKSKCSFRLTQEIIYISPRVSCYQIQRVDTMLPYISDCMIHVTLSDLITLLYQPNPLNTVLSNETQDLLKIIWNYESVQYNITVLLYCM